MNQINQGIDQQKEHFISLNAFPRVSCQRSYVQWMVQSPPLKYVLLILLMACTLLTLFATSLRPTDVQIQGTGDGMKHITLPLEEHSDLSGQNSKDYILTGSFSSSLFSQHLVHITSDDCLESLRINGVDVDLHTVIAGNTCDRTYGFDIDLKNYLQEGTNHFEIWLRDDGDWFGLSITHSSYDRPYFVLLLLLLLEMATLLYFFFKNYLQLPRGIVIVILLGFLLHLLYLSYTPYNMRTYDITEYGGHLDYIKYVAQYFRLPEVPNPNGDWEYHQPPLYYLTATVFYTLSNTIGLDHQIVLQGVSLVCFTIFLLFGVLILRIVCKRKWVFFTSTALLFFWPSGIIHSIRIGNDVMYYMLSVIALYFLMRWLVDKKSHYFYAAALFVGLTIATKLNGLILLGIFGCSLLIMAIGRTSRAMVRSSQLKTVREIAFTISSLQQFLWVSLKKPQTAEYVKKTLFLISIVVFALYVSLFRSVRIALQDGHYDLLVSNISENNSGLRVENTLNNYTHFDLNIYIKQAFTDTWHDEGGRQYFFNFFLKSMLFGEFSFPFAAGQLVAKLLSVLLLQMIVFFFVGCFVSIRKWEPCNLLMIVWFSLSLFALVYTRHTYPISGFADFRYIFPAIIPFISMYVTGIDFCIERKFRILGGLGYMLAFLFIFASCFFFIIPLGT